MGKPLWLYPALALSLLAVGFAVMDAWLLAGQDVERGMMIAVIGLQALVLTAAAWIGAALLELRVLRPLRRVRDHLAVFLHSDSDHRLDVGPGHSLDDLPDLVVALGHQLSRERLETARAMEAVAERVDHRKSRLEAILRDLHEGVIVCNNEHRIVLFNQSAWTFFERTGPIGLHRPVTALLAGGGTATAYENLKRLSDEQHDASLLSRFTDRTVDGREVDMRMSLIVEQEGGCSGYVLSFSNDKAGEEGAFQARRPGVLSDRPEFYDFSLFDTPYEAEQLARRLNELDYVVFDTETTGLSPSRGDRIVQISGVRLVHGRPTGEEFDTLVNPGMTIPPASIRFHGITDDMVADAPSEASAVTSFHKFVEGAVLVAHNAAFDMKFLRLREAEAGIVFDNPVMDTLLMSFILQPEHTAHTLDAIAARFGVGISDEVRHTALGDARATAEVFVKMLPVLERQGLETLGQVLEASDRIFHIRKQQEQL